MDGCAPIKSLPNSFPIDGGVMCLSYIYMVTFPPPPTTMKGVVYIIIEHEEVIVPCWRALFHGHTSR
jgi:hypothetical protein